MSSNLPPRAKRAFRLPLLRRSTASDEMEEEILFHLEARTEQLVLQGLAPSEARAEAARRFGSLSDARERLKRSAGQRQRRLRLREIASDVLQDARIACRGLFRTPGFLMLTVLCLSLGIGANAAIYSVIDAVLLRPLPFADPARLVRIWTAGAPPPGIYEIMSRESHSYDGLAGFIDARNVSVTGSGAPVRYVASEVTANLFDVLGVRPVVGRAFLPGENAVGHTNVAILSYSVWRELYGGNTGVVGSTVTMDGISHTVVGVMPEDFRFPSADVQIWMPATFNPAAPTYWWGAPLRLVGRLEPGASRAQARAEAAIVLPRARRAFPMRMPDDWGKNVDVVSLRESVVGGARPTLLLLFAAVGLVLLIACVNVATLYVDRASMREREIAIRAALGAGRAQIIAQLLTESLIVAALGAAAGLLLAIAGVRTLVAILPAGTPRASEIAVDGHVLAFTIVLATLSGLAFGMLPALRATRLDVQSTLRRDGRAGDASRRAIVTRALAVGQVALAVVIVTASGLVLKSFWRLHQVDVGFDTRHVMAAEIPLPSFDHDTAAQAPMFYDALLEKVRAIPGVRAAAAATGIPFGATEYGAAMEVESHPTPPGGVPAWPIRVAVTPDYFRVLAIPVLRGRVFSDVDRANTLLVAVIDASAAKSFWPGEEAIGQRIRYVWSQQWITVVGVVGNVKRDSLNSTVQPSIYIPMTQGFGEPMVVVLRASGDAQVTKLAPAVRSVVAEVDPRVPVIGVRRLDGVVDLSAARARFAATLLALFAAVALLLGATGIYGLMTASVTRRTREIGVRMALGASSHGVLWMVLRESARVTTVGLLVGVAGAIAAGRLLRGLLFGVGMVDVTVLAAVTALLGIVAILAGIAPARRVARVDLLTSIRADG